MKKQEKDLLHQLHAGKIKFTLYGKKLKGEYALVKAYGRGENSWLLMKLDDKYASKEDITLKDKSVVSKKNLDQVAKTSTNIYGKTKRPKKLAETVSEKVESAVEDEIPNTETSEKDIKDYLKDAAKTPFFDKVEPMLATLVDKPFDDNAWLYEIKWDGYRAVAFMEKGEVELKSRNNKSFNEKFYPIYDTLKKWGINAVMDGEIVVVNEKGTANFGALQNWRSEADGELLYYVFDMLWYNGYDLKALPLMQRKAILQTLIPPDSSILFSQGFETSGIEFLEAAKKMGLEGIMAKRKDSLYEVGHRTDNWLKIKANKRQEVVIGGYTKIWVAINHSVRCWLGCLKRESLFTPVKLALASI